MKFQVSVLCKEDPWMREAVVTADTRQEAATLALEEYPSSYKAVVHGTIDWPKRG